MLLKQIENIGLDKRQAKIYLACLELGPSSIARIAKKSGLNRATIYEVIEGLIHEKLISTTIKGKRKFYIAESPEKIKLLLQEKLRNFNNILPELFLLAKDGDVKPKITYYEGISGIIKIYLESLQAKDDALIGFSGLEKLIKEPNALLNFWEQEYIPKRKHLNKIVKLVAPDNKIGKQLRLKDTNQYRETKLLPNTYYNFEAEIFTYDNIVNFISYSDGEEFALTLESKPIAVTVKMIWQICWNVAY